MCTPKILYDPLPDNFDTRSGHWRCQQILYTNSFPELPFKNYEINGFIYVPTNDELLILESLSVDSVQSVAIEKNTKDQSNNQEWITLRRDWLTASKDFKRVYSRQGYYFILSEDANYYHKLAEEIFSDEKSYQDSSNGKRHKVWARCC